MSVEVKRSFVLVDFHIVHILFSAYRFNSADHKISVNSHLWDTSCCIIGASQRYEVLYDGKSRKDYVQELPVKVCNRGSLPRLYV